MYAECSNQYYRHSKPRAKLDRLVGDIQFWVIRQKTCSNRRWEWNDKTSTGPRYYRYVCLYTNLWPSYCCLYGELDRTPEHEYCCDVVSHEFPAGCRSHFILSRWVKTCELVFKLWSEQKPGDQRQTDKLTKWRLEKEKWSALACNKACGPQEL